MNGKLVDRAREGRFELGNEWNVESSFRAGAKKEGFLIGESSLFWSSKVTIPFQAPIVGAAQKSSVLLIKIRNICRAFSKI